MLNNNIIIKYMTHPLKQTQQGIYSSHSQAQDCTSWALTKSLQGTGLCLRDKPNQDKKLPSHTEKKILVIYQSKLAGCNYGKFSIHSNFHTREARMTWSLLLTRLG